MNNKQYTNGEKLEYYKRRRDHAIKRIAELEKLDLNEYTGQQWSKLDLPKPHELETLEEARKWSNPEELSNTPELTVEELREMIQQRQIQKAKNSVNPGND